MTTHQSPEEFLTLLPYRLAFYDRNLQLIYSNNQPDGSFFLEADEQTLPQWIWEALQQASEKALFLPLANDSFDQILIQSYQALYDADGNFRGVVSYIQDFQPVLSTYLKESGQALVGWSDTTSGASIKDKS
ncbi:sodium transporter [Streptococcus dentapri]|uniref:Sodium transporter n=1 Tax=Streptococcus dentapri TaxID=573564 RepID=A0ABV8CZR9_9STRE